MIDRSLMTAFLNGELSDQEAAPVLAALDCDPEARRLADELDDAGQLGYLIEDALALIHFNADSQAVQAFTQLRELGSTIATDQVEETTGRKFADNASSIQVPCIFGDYELLEVLSEGGMGTVFKARHRHLHRFFALKVIAPHRLGCEQARRRFQREVALNGCLNHPHLVQAVSAGEVDGQPFLVMELLEGEDVARVARRWGQLPIAEACEIVRQAAIGIDFLARQGFVHRDLKPSNLMLTRGNFVGSDMETARRDSGCFVKILDLGLACAPEASQSVELTMTDQVLGTIDYLAPEQATDPRRVDTRADVYSLGCTLYRLLAGMTPFSCPGMETPVAKLLAHHQRQPVSLRQIRRDLPAELTIIVDRAMAKKPSRRYPNGRELAEALEPFRTGSDLGRLLDTQTTLPLPAAPETNASPYRVAFARLLLLSILCMLIALGVVIRVRSNHMKITVTTPDDQRRVEVEVSRRDVVVRDVAPPPPQEPAARGNTPNDANKNGKAETNRLVFPFDAAQAVESQANWAARIGIPVQVTNSIGMEMRLIPPGRGPTETASELRCEYPMLMTINEITRSEFQRVMRRLPQYESRESPSNNESLPVGYVTWHEAIDFCRRLSDLPEERQAGRQYCLPTQAEWAWACRAGNDADLPWPSERARDHAAMREPMPRRVASFAPNPFGLFDMHGNIAEWAADWTTIDERSTGDEISGSRTYTYHLAPVLCGGSYESTRASDISATARAPHVVDHAARPDCGFRVIARIDSEPASSESTDGGPLPLEAETGFDPMIVRDGSLRGWGFPGGYVTNTDGMLEQAVDDEHGNWGTIWYGRHGNLHDFDFRFEFKVEGRETESQLLFRANVLEKGWQLGSHYRLFLSGPRIGLLYRYDPSGIRVVAVFPAVQLAMLRADTWNRLALRCEGRRTRLWLNDMPVVDFTDSMPDACLHGPLSFLTTGPTNTPRRQALFRHLRIKLLGSPPAESLKPMPWTMGADALPANSPPEAERANSHELQTRK